MAFSGVRSFWSSVTGSGGTRRIAVEAQGGYDFLPQDSVIISDRKRHANKLGEGSFAKVYRGEYNGKPCAVKVFKEDIVKKELSPDPGVTSEVQVLSKLQHTNIVQMYGMWLNPHKDRAAPSIVMELCDGSLYEFIRRYKGKIVPKIKKLAILQDIARGMVYLHGQNIVHGDLRSSNVLLCHSEDQTVAKIADFDMARFLDKDAQHHFTTTHTAEEYLPPEVFDHSEHKDLKKKWARLTPKVDVFCFGELVLEMGCGSYPMPTRKFRGQEMLTELQRRERHMLKLKQSDKESLGSIIQKCLADAPEGRPYFTEILLEVDGYLHMYRERPDLEKLQDKTAECEALRAEAVKWEGEAKSLSSVQDVLERELEKEKAEKQDLQSELREARDDLTEKVQLVATRDAELKVLNEKLVDCEKQMKDDQNAFKEGYRKLRDEKDKLSRDLVKVEQDKEDLKARKAAVEKDLVRARKMAKDLLDERVVVNAESEQQMENLNERLMEFKQQAVLSEERLKQVQGLEGEHLDLKVQLKTLMTTLEDFQKVLTDEQKSRKSLDASVKALTAEIDQLRTELKERDNEVSSLAAANKHLQRKVDAADANSGEMKAELTQLRTELKERDNKVSSLTAANGGLQRKVDAADADITEMKAKSTSLKKQVKSLTNDKKSLKQTLDAAKAAIQKHKNDYEDCQEKLREAEQQVALFQGKRQQLEVLEGVAVELKSRLSDLMMDAPPLPTPSVSGGKDGASAVALTQEAAQKVQLLESERDSLKAERHMYQMKWLAAEDMMEAVKNDRQSLEESLELSRLALRGAKVHVQVTEQSLREEYKRKNSEAYEVIKRLQHPQEGCAEYPSEKTKISALVDLCKYFRDENMETLERAAEEKQKMLVSMKEADERVKEMTSTIAALKECIQVQDAEVRDLQAQLAPRQGMAVIPVPPPSDVADLTGDEVVLEQLCYMAIGIKQLLISPDGGTFTLGNGDASLEFPPGAVQKDIHIRYAIILHGPFVFPAGFKPGSVVVYINMDGATLVKPVQLLLSHWCIREETDDEETMKFVRAPHSLESGKKEYAFEELEDEADFTTRTNVGVLTIQEPQCLFCVKSKREKVARYCAMTFFRYDSSEETLLFRIQLSCDSLDWIEELASVLDRRGWQHSSASRDIVPRFCFSARQIAASPPVSRGPGWNAMIEGAHNVKEADFLMPIGKSKAALKREVNSGCFPPYICYQILYSLPEERRVMPTFLKVDLDGADVPLTFSCRFYQAENPASPVSPAFFSSATSPHTPGRMAASYGPSPATSGHIPSAERHPSSRQAEISQPAATAVPDAVTDGPSATTPPTETAADILDHFRDQFINDAASSDIMYELKHKDVISSGDVEMIERKAGVTQQNQYLHKCLTGKCTKEALMEVCNVMEAVKGNPRINALGKDMRRRVKASYGPSPATSGPIPSAERHPSSPQAETSKTADPTSPVSPAFFSSATSPRTPGRMTASYGPSPATSGHIPSAERHPSSPQAEISKPTEVIEALNHDLDAQWREFGTHLCVKPSSMDIIDKNNKSDAGACMLQLVEKWLVQENGTGDLPRTWVTVVQAVKKTGKGRLAEELAQRYGVQLPGQ